ncbi:hypothetical protein DHW03_05765 [Pedobacter yonginense]|uniref:Na+/H+ antiporter NhaC-like C-terminal domain-containing protein n=1 Tax=Pedobacter yonginense TaxID=651869 RepID=A0A317EQZ6_9SPHI|nr:Na+/H+ antiporter NhaC family protein [Pedobacter yonginense]PWS29321.1 hypothetical protein DHW03_05765 [Pedobacter yonginense]
MGIYSLIPPLIVILLAIKTKSSLIPLVAGTFVGFLMLAFIHVDPVTGNTTFGTQTITVTAKQIAEAGSKEKALEAATEAAAVYKFPNNFINGVYKILMLNEKGEGPNFNGTYYNSLLWVLIVCGLFGPFIQLMIASGGISAIGDKLITKLKNRKQSLLATYFLGFVFFVDDYLNALSVGATMRNVTDKFGVPREKIGYIIGAVCVPIAVLFPISTWTVYVGGLMKDGGGYSADAGEIDVFMATIPFSIYAWVAMLVALLYILKVIPDFGAFKTAQKRVDDGGSNAAPNSESLSIDIKEYVLPEKKSVWSFLVPMIVLVVATVYFDKDVYKGIMCALTVLIAQYWLLKVMPFSAILEQFEEGFKTMTFVLVVLIVTYLLKEVGDQMGLTKYVVGGIKAFPVQLLPLMIFLAIGAIAIATGSSWGVYAVVTPIVFALAKETGMNPMLGMGSLISAGVMGANICFYSDSRILTASSTESNMTAQAISQLPYVIITTVITAIVFLILGFTM